MSNTAAARPAVFTPEIAAAINRAYHKAYQMLIKEGRDHLRPELAGRMMELARNGESDEHRLCLLAYNDVVGTRRQEDAKVMPPAAAPGATGLGSNLKRFS